MVDGYVIPFQRNSLKEKASNKSEINAFIPYNHFKMEGLQNLRYLLQEGDYMCKLDLEDVYYCVPL